MRLFIIILLLTGSWCKEDLERESYTAKIRIESEHEAQDRWRERQAITDAQSPSQPNPS